MEKIIIKVKDKKYEMVKEYKNVILFRDSSGNAECFTKNEINSLLRKQ